MIESADAEQHFEESGDESPTRRLRRALPLHFAPMRHRSCALPLLTFPLDCPRLHPLTELHRLVQLPGPLRIRHAANLAMTPRVARP